MNGKNLKYFVMGAAIVAAGLGAFAITLPAAFTSGEVLSAAKLNSYFTAIKTAIDALEANGSVNTAKIADGAVATAKVADGAVNAAKTADESGANKTYDAAIVAVPATIGTTSLRSITLEAPEAGFAVVTASFVARGGHTTGTADNLVFKLSKTAGDFDALTDAAVSARIPAANPTTSLNDIDIPVTTTNVFAVVKGTNTIHLNGLASRTGFEVYRVNLTAVYVPTRYGTGSTIN